MKLAVHHISVTGVVTVLLILCGIYEGTIGVMQLAGVLPSGHHDYRVTGDFYNPGPFACFLSVIFPIALYYAIHIDNKFQKWLGTGMVFLCAILVPATLSRTALAACVIGGIVALLTCMNFRSCNRRLLLLVVIVLVIVGGGAYFIKKESADGRFLMWKVASRAAIEAPVDGVGWSNVAGTYGEAQERYFNSGVGTEAEMTVADAPEYVFNEYLQVAIAFGIPAAIAMMVIIAGGVIVAIRNRSFGLAGSAAAVAVVMMASYPLQFPLFVVTIGVIVSGCYLSSRSMVMNILGPVSVTVACALFLTHDDTADVRQEFGIGRSLHKMRNYRKSNEILQALIPHSSDPMILNIIGKNYQSLGKPDSAEYFFKKSVNRCPNRLYPHYLLMNLYSDSVSFDRDKMLREAEILTTKKEKIPSPAVDEMRQAARAVLNENKE